MQTPRTRTDHGPFPDELRQRGPDFRILSGRMLLSELDYELPAELIAQEPAQPRDSARLMIVNRATGVIEHQSFRDLPSYLRSSDCLVLNDTRVLPARFFCRRSSGARVEGLFLREREGLWHVLLRPSRRLRPGEVLAAEAEDAIEHRSQPACMQARLPQATARAEEGRYGAPRWGGGYELVVVERVERGEWLVRVEPAGKADEILARIGQPPLPPYIRAQRRSGHKADYTAEDAEKYQTVYAARPGAVAAPTAGMHFTPELLESIREMGVSIATVTLHVGAGTFAPVEVDDLRAHRMHAEQYAIDADQWRLITAARNESGRVVAIGTTTCRTLEAVAQDGSPAPALAGWTDILIAPPYAFSLTDVLITNFHLPRSTLLALVMAFAGKELVREAYVAAVREGYRFYSYGDAMLIV